MKKPVTLIIMDGYGLGEVVPTNAIYRAGTPNMNRLMAACPTTRLFCSGLDVGLPDGQMGNSEVGHTNMGAGRVVYQELTRITKSIADGEFFKNHVLLEAVNNCKKNGSALHLFGLLSDGGVHSHTDHLYALLRLAKNEGLERVYIHCLLDGRDVPPSSGAGFVAALQKEIEKIGVGKIATVMGRYYAMDRDNRWERVERAYAAMVYGEGVAALDPLSAVEESYKNGVTDEFMIPAVCPGAAPISEGDSVICFNFRPDRAREITRTMVDKDFGAFPRRKGFFPLHYVCFTQYDAEMPSVSVAFSPQSLKNTFGEYISSLGLTQLRIAETEKYAHVTFFFNGGVEKVYPGEDRCLVPSPKVATYDLKPEMSAYEVKDAVIERIESGKYDVIVLNFANCDMVGHTGVLEAAQAAAYAVDDCVGQVVEAVERAGGICLITADHGNAEAMLDPDGYTPFTAHTTNPVPCVITGADGISLREGRLADIAPTLLELMGLSKPPEMEGESIIVK